MNERFAEIPLGESRRKTSSLKQEYGINLTELQLIDRRARQIAPISAVVFSAVSFLIAARLGEAALDLVNDAWQNRHVLAPIGDIFLGVQCSTGDQIGNPYCQK